MLRKKHLPLILLILLSPGLIASADAKKGDEVNIDLATTDLALVEVAKHYDLRLHDAEQKIKKAELRTLQTSLLAEKYKGQAQRYAVMFREYAEAMCVIEGGSYPMVNCPVARAQFFKTQGVQIEK